MAGIPQRWPDPPPRWREGWLRMRGWVRVLLEAEAAGLPADPELWLQLMAPQVQERILHHPPLMQAMSRVPHRQQLSDPWSWDGCRECLMLERLPDGRELAAVLRPGSPHIRLADGLMLHDLWIQGVPG